jgi:flagellar assembly protein FliH
MTASTYSFRQLDGPPASGVDALSSALAEAEAIRERARAEGEAAGRAEAAAAVQAQAAELLDLLGEAVRAAQSLGDDLIATSQADSVAIGLRLAEQIVAGAIDAAPERLVDVAGQALRRLAERRLVTLVVNPSELEVLSAAVEQLRAQLGGIDSLNVQSDRRVGRGGVVARTQDGEIDATVEAQLSRAREIVADELSR